MYQKYESTIKALAYDFFQNKEDAEDAIQEVSLKLVGMEPPTDNPDAWAYVVIRNAVNDELRKWKTKNRAIPSYSDEYVDENTPFEYVAERDVALALASNYNNLPDDIKETYYLRYQLGLSYEMIAHEQGIPIGTVGSRIARGKELLSLELDK